ncbi:unnamed protein product (mitochondrion) [Plasmodiophora brassicae]|uniref:Protein YIF1 n=2 Tax=Plasmodiophora brassicae TaxID=37360 RepID=A0A3P3YI61_PLABS|nr:unnamed protein product [Plasmodiophora brassicae]
MPAAPPSYQGDWGDWAPPAAYPQHQQPPPTSQYYDNGSSSSYYNQGPPAHNPYPQVPFNPYEQKGPYNTQGPGSFSRTPMQSTPGMAGIPNEMMTNMALGLIDDKVKTYSSWFSLSSLRYYFHVNNAYVVKKLQMILLPYLHKRWSRERSGNDGAGAFLPPSADVNAPDLYIPLMAFVTYILLMGFIMGISKAFTPEVLGSTATWALLVLIMEVVLLRVGFAVIGSSATVVPPSLLDLVAYSSYKFVILVIDLVVWVASYHNSTMYWVISILTGISMTVFMARTLQRAFVPRVEGGSFGIEDTNRSTRQLFLIAVGVCQIPLCIVLGRSVAR